MTKIMTLVMCLSLGQTAPQASVRFQDGSVVHMAIQNPMIDIETRYGVLKVPMGDVRSVMFGVHFAPGHEEKVRSMVVAIGSTVPKEREAAQKVLQAMPAAYHILVRAAATSADMEVKQRAAQIARSMEAAFHDEVLKLNPDDILLTTDNQRITGKIISGDMKGVSKSLGEVVVKLHEASSMTIQKGNSLQMVVLPDKGWQKTGIFVDNFVAFNIVAEGNIDLWPQGAGQYVTGPNGYTTAAKGGSHMAGSLIGRIGENGKEFFVGASCKTPTLDRGELFLSIAQSPWNNESAGKYDVRITLAIGR